MLSSSCTSTRRAVHEPDEGPGCRETRVSSNGVDLFSNYWSLMTVPFMKTFYENTDLHPKTCSCDYGRGFVSTPFRSGTLNTRVLRKERAPVGQKILSHSA